MRVYAASALLFSLLAFTPGAFAQGSAVIADGKNVKLDYTLSVDGKVVDTTKGKQPVAYIQGQHTILPGLEKQLAGLKAGDHKKIELPAEEGFGKVHPEAVIEVPKSKMPEGEIKVGTVLSTQGPDGRPMRATIKEIKNDTVTLDFNHPLAGKTLDFDVDVVDVS